MSFFVNRLCFNVTGDLGFGQDIRLSGNNTVLGCDDPNAAIPLVTSHDTYPTWKLPQGFLDVPGDPRKIKYRYCIFTGGKFDRWESADERVLDYFKFVNGICTVDDKLDVSQKEHNDLTHNPIGVKYDEHQHRFAAANKYLNDADTVMIVTYFLPVQLTKNESGEWHVAWDPYDTLSFNLFKTSVIYVGVVLFNGEGIPLDQQEEVTAVLKPFNCHPVYLSTEKHEVFGGLLSGYHQWQIMHDKVNVFAPLDELLSETLLYANYWHIYSDVHTAFQSKVVELYQFDYLIWIHDYQLMLLPERIRRKIPTARIGYVFHVPFPVSDTWLTMYKRDELLRGVLAADQIGFQTYEYASNFTSTCCRLLGHNYYMNELGQSVVNVIGREVVISSINKGVNLRRVREICRDQNAERFVEAVGKWRDRFRGKTIIGGMADSEEFLKGISVKFIEFDTFLSENPQYLEYVVFVLIGITPPVPDSTYRVYEGETRGSVAHINRKFGREVVYYEERKACDMVLADRLAYFAAVDVFHMTAPIHSVTAYSHEFVLARHELEGLSNRGLAISISLPTNGLMILSMYHSCEEQLLGAIIVDPRKTGETKKAIKKVLEMTPEEIPPKTKFNLEYVLRTNADRWALTMLDDLKSASTAVPPGMKYSIYISNRYQMFSLNEGFKTLQTDKVVQDYRRGKCRLILLNSEIVEQMPEEQRVVIESLGVDKKNLIFLVGRKSKEVVAQLLNNSKYIGFGAEYGYCYRWPLNKFSPDVNAIIAPTSIGEWQNAGYPLNVNWRDQVRGIMDLFAKHTDQVFVEAHQHSLRWNFGFADPEFAFAQSRALEDFIANEMSFYDIDMTQSRAKNEAFLEVRSRGVSKGAFLDSILLTLQSVHVEVDFLLAVGMDETDESLFACANRLPSSELFKHKNVTVYTATVGKKPTFAQACFSDQSEALWLLQKLVSNVFREKKAYSTGDLLALHREQSTGLNLPRADTPAVPFAEKVKSDAHQTAEGEESGDEGGAATEEEQHEQDATITVKRTQSAPDVMVTTTFHTLEAWLPPQQHAATSWEEYLERNVTVKDDSSDDHGDGSTESPMEF